MRVAWCTDRSSDPWWGSPQRSEAQNSEVTSSWWTNWLNRKARIMQRGCGYWYPLASRNKIAALIYSICPIRFAELLCTESTKEVYRRHSNARQKPNHGCCCRRATGTIWCRFNNYSGWRDTSQHSDITGARRNNRAKSRSLTPALQDFPRIQETEANYRSLLLVKKISAAKMWQRGIQMKKGDGRLRIIRVHSLWFCLFICCSPMGRSKRLWLGTWNDEALAKATKKLVAFLVGPNYDCTRLRRRRETEKTEKGKDLGYIYIKNYT